MDSKSVLFITYNGVLEPIMQSQGIPYLKGLAEKGYRICILSFEKKDKKNTDFKSCVSAMRQQLKDENMEWRMLRYHKRPSLLATGFDMMCGIAYAFLLALKTKAGIIHCRATIPAVMGLPAAKVLKRKFLYDMRGINAHEYVDGDLWPAGGMNFKAMDTLEKRLVCLSDAIVVLTKKFADFLEKPSYFAAGKKLNLHVIPCCVDLDKFSVSAGKNKHLQHALHLEDKFVFLYSGSVGTWYMLQEMIDFFKEAKKIKANSHFLVVTQSPEKQTEAVFMNKGIARTDYTVTSAVYSDMPRYLSLADAGIFFIKPVFSKIASSPTKMAEYLACGVPVVINSEIGDTDIMVREYGIGVVADVFNEGAYRKCMDDLMELKKKPDVLKQRCRKIAEDCFSLNKGVASYEKIYSGLICGAKLCAV